jgi:hypothetical protein
MDAVVKSGELFAASTCVSEWVVIVSAGLGVQICRSKMDTLRDDIHRDVCGRPQICGPRRGRSYYYYVNGREDIAEVMPWLSRRSQPAGGASFYELCSMYMGWVFTVFSTQYCLKK